MSWGFGRIKQLEFTAVAATAIAITCVMIGQGAERYAASATAPTETALGDPDSEKSGVASHGAPAFNAIDYATTGSIKGQTVVISPCTGEQTQR